MLKEVEQANEVRRGKGPEFKDALLKQGSTESLGRGSFFFFSSKNLNTTHLPHPP